MYAIIETGGKQYKVQKNMVIDVELLPDSDSTAVEFDKVLFWQDGSTSHVGKPHIANCLVKAERVDITRGPKLIAYKYKRRKGYRRKVGHRQTYTQVKILDILSR